jgi:hypothetical protein
MLEGGAGMIAVASNELRCCHDPSAAWPTFARRERRKNRLLRSG